MKILWFKTIGSTNKSLFEDKENLSNKTVYAAEFQTSGKGQRENNWESAEGQNLLFSILIKPTDILAEHQFIISQAVALGIVAYLKSKGVEAAIKWPNDIYVGDNKICGILIENTVNGGYLICSIIGIGFNLNQKYFFSDANNPISLSTLTDIDYAVRDELKEMLHFIFMEYDERNSSTESNYISKLYRLGKKSTFIHCATNKSFEGTIKGVDACARIIIETNEGDKSFAFKEIKYVI